MVLPMYFYWEIDLLHLTVLPFSIWKSWKNFHFTRRSVHIPGVDKSKKRPNEFPDVSIHCCFVQHKIDGPIIPIFKFHSILHLVYQSGGSRMRFQGGRCTAGDVGNDCRHTGYSWREAIDASIFIYSEESHTPRSCSGNFFLTSLHPMCILYWIIWIWIGIECDIRKGFDSIILKCGRDILPHTSEDVTHKAFKRIICILHF